MKRGCSKIITLMKSFYYHQNLVEQVPFLPFFYAGGGKSLETLGGLLRSHSI